MADIHKPPQTRSVSSKSQTPEKELDAIADGSVRSPETQSAHDLEKAEAIRRACDLRDIDALVSHATSEGGLLQDELRRLACMLPTILLDFIR